MSGVSFADDRCNSCFVLNLQGRKFHIFDYEKLANPELTDDNPVFCAMYNPTSMTFITAAGQDVKIWDAQPVAISRGTTLFLQIGARCIAHLHTATAPGVPESRIAHSRCCGPSAVRLTTGPGA